MGFDPVLPVGSLRTHALVARLAFVLAAIFVAAVMPLFRLILSRLAGGTAQEGRIEQLPVPVRPRWPSRPRVTPR